MRQNDLLRYTRAQPFRPFRIRMVSGTTFDIRHSEMIRVGMSSCVVFFPQPDEPDAYDRFSMIGQQLIEQIDLIEEPSAVTKAGGPNGPPQK